MEEYSDEKPQEKHNFLFILTLLYLIIFYTQPGGRYPIIATLRIELLIGSFILVAIVVSGAWERLMRTFAGPFVTFFFIAMCLSFFGAMMTHTTTEAWPVFVKLVKFFSIYIMIVATVDSERKLKIFVWTYLAMILLLIGEPVLNSNFAEGEGGVIRLRGYGQFAHSNSLGMNAICNLPFTVFLASYYRKFAVRIGLLLFALLMIWVTILTGSRTSYVGGIAIVFFIGWYSQNRAKYFVIAALVGLMLLPMVPDGYRDRFLSLGDAVTVMTSDEPVRGSIGARWNITKIAVGVFLDYPLVGCGLDSFIRVANREHGNWVQSHSLYLQLLTNTGIIGTIAFSLLVYQIYRSLLESKTKLIALGEGDSYLSSLSSATLVFLLARLACGLFAQTLYSNIWWIAAGLAVVLARLTNEIAEKAELPEESTDMVDIEHLEPVSLYHPGDVS